jgi:hypothetical protein
MTGHDIFSSSSSGGGSSSNRRPSKLVRIKQHAGEAVAGAPAAAAAAIAAAVDAHAVHEKVAAVAGNELEFGEGCSSGELIGTAVATAAEEMLISGNSGASGSSIASIAAGQSQAMTQGGSSVGYFELSALQRALDQP